MRETISKMRNISVKPFFESPRRNEKVYLQEDTKIEEMNWMIAKEIVGVGCGRANRSQFLSNTIDRVKRKPANIGPDGNIIKASISIIIFCSSVCLNQVAAPRRAHDSLGWSVVHALRSSSQIIHHPRHQPTCFIKFIELLNNLTQTQSMHTFNLQLLNCLAEICRPIICSRINRNLVRLWAQRGVVSLKIRLPFVEAEMGQLRNWNRINILIDSSANQTSWLCNRKWKRPCFSFYWSLMFRSSIEIICVWYCSGAMGDLCDCMALKSIRTLCSFETCIEFPNFRQISCQHVFLGLEERCDIRWNRICRNVLYSHVRYSITFDASLKFGHLCLRNMSK